jgi:hypothetical protein
MNFFLSFKIYDSSLMAKEHKKKEKKKKKKKITKEEKKNPPFPQLANIDLSSSIN